MIRKTLLYRSGTDGGWCANHVQGCMHGCRYPCYAMAMAKRTGRVKSREEWVRPQVVENAVDLLRVELAKKAGTIDRVHLCFSTDPFMYDEATTALVPEVLDITLELIALLNASGIPVRTLTKGVYPTALLGDSDPRNEFGVTAVSLSESFRAEWEPGAAPVEDRIASLERLSGQGFRTWAVIEPYPTPNVDPTAVDIAPLLDRLAFVDRLVFGRWNYSKLVGRHPGAAEFYRQTAQTVLDWGQATGTEVHVKEATLRRPSATGPAPSCSTLPQLELFDRRR